MTDSARDAHNERVRQEEAKQIEKLILLYAELHHLNPAYELVDDAKPYGIAKGIRLTSKKGTKDEETATLYIESKGGSWFRSWEPRRYYVRITTSSSWICRWEKNWTFETKDLITKVNTKMTSFLEQIQRDKETRRQSQTDAVRRMKETQAAFPAAEHYGTTNDPRAMYVTIKLDNEEYGTTQDFDYRPDDQVVAFHKTPFISRDAFEEILEIIKKDLTESRKGGILNS
jgi:hypothetical protein